MSHRSPRWRLLALSGCMLCCSADGQPQPQWPRFRGPNGSGVSPAKGIPVEFGPDRNLLWKTAVPLGHSSPVLSDGRVFLTGFSSGSLITLCFDSASGELLWSKQVERRDQSPLGPENNPASPSASTDGENVYVFFQDFGLLSYTSQGRERWRLPLGPFNNLYGMAASPILEGGLLVLLCDQDTDSYLLAVEKDSGRVRWKTPRPQAGHGHSTPSIWRPDGVPRQIIAAGSFELAAYSLDKGEKLWRVGGLPWQMKALPLLNGENAYVNGRSAEGAAGAKIPTFEEAVRQNDRDGDGVLDAQEVPAGLARDWFAGIDRDRDGRVDAGEWRFFQEVVDSQGGLLAVRLGGSGDRTSDNILWRYDRSVADVSSVLFYRERLYMINDGGILMAFDPGTGELLQRGRIRGAVGNYFASPVAAEGRIYLVSQSGAVSVIEAGDPWKVLAVNQLNEECFATPALAEGRIYIRTTQTLYCFAAPDPRG